MISGLLKTLTALPSFIADNKFRRKWLYFVDFEATKSNKMAKTPQQNGDQPSSLGQAQSINHNRQTESPQTGLPS